MERIDPRELLIRVVKILERLNIPYLVTGGIAVLVWGRPRFTADIDIVVELNWSDIPKLEKALRGLSEAGYIDRGAIEDALTRRGEFNFIEGRTGVKVDFWIPEVRDPFDASRFKRRIVKKILGQKIHFISPEDLILAKLVWYKEAQSSRQLEDVESILKISGRKLDKRYLKKWAVKLSVAGLLRKLVK